MREDEAMAGRQQGLLAIWPGPSLELPLSFVYREARQDEPVLRAVHDVVAAAWGKPRLQPFRRLDYPHPDSERSGR